MTAPSSSSFIPKQPAQGKIKKRNTRKVYVLTYVSFVLFFGTLIAAGGVFFYKLSMQSQLEYEKQRLLEQQRQFNQADFERVKAFDKKLSDARNLLDQHVSVLSIIEALEDSTLSSVELSSFSLDRTKFNDIAVSLTAITDDFNSVLFQREILDDNSILKGVDITELSSENVAVTEGGFDFVEKKVSFSMNKDFTADEIPYVPRVPEQVNNSSNEDASLSEASTDEVSNADVSTEQGDLNNETL